MSLFKKLTIYLVAGALVSVSAPIKDASGTQISVTRRGLRLRKDVKTIRQMKTQYLVFQEYDFSCGAAVVSTLLTYYFGEPATEKEVIAGLFKRSNVKLVLQRRAFSLLDMKKFALAKGYKAVGYRMDFEFLADLSKKQPVIVPINIRNYDHFVIVKGIVGDRVVIADPALGNYTMRVGRFMPIWKGGIGFILKKLNPTGPMVNEDMKLRFMATTAVGRLTTTATHSFNSIPGSLQTIQGPSPGGGSFTSTFGIPTGP